MDGASHATMQCLGRGAGDRACWLFFRGSARVLLRDPHPLPGGTLALRLAAVPLRERHVVSGWHRGGVKHFDLSCFLKSCSDPKGTPLIWAREEVQGHNSR